MEFDGASKVTEQPNDLNLKAPPIVLIAGIVFLPSVASALIDAYRDLVYGGLIVEFENDELIVRSDRRLPYGTIMVLEDDISIYSVKTEPNKAELLGALSKLTSRKEK